MRKLKSVLLALLLASMMIVTLTATASEQGGLIETEEEAVPIDVPDSVTSSGIEFIEGLNDDEAVNDGLAYAADVFGFEYTPTVSYDLKKVELIAGEDSGWFTVQLRPDSAGMPGTTILRETTFWMESTVSWQGTEFSTSYPLTAGTTYWIVIEPDPGSQGSVATSGTPVTYTWHFTGDGTWDGMGTEPWMVKFYEEVQEFDYNFGLWPWPDCIIRCNIVSGYWIHGILDCPGLFEAPLLGKVAGDYVWFAVDLPGPIELMFFYIGFYSGDGYAYRIHIPDMTLYGPDYVYLVPESSASGDGPDPSVDVGSSEVTPVEATYHFNKNPWTDVLHLRDDIVPWVWGHSTGFGACYPAPILGYVQDGTLYYATDGIDDVGCNYELLFDEVSLITGQGSGIGTATGYTYDYLGTWWLTFASSEEEGTGTPQLR